MQNTRVTIVVRRVQHFEADERRLVGNIYITSNKKCSGVFNLSFQRFCKLLF